MNAWNEPLTRENFTGFFNRYSPAAYRSVYKMIGDTTRTESVLLDAFVETFHERNSPEQMDPVEVFGSVLQKKALHMASKYPLPANYQFSVRSLDEFTQTMLLSDILRKIDSLPFKAFDMLSSSAVHRMPGGAGLPRMVGNFTHSGVSLLLIAQLVAVALIIAIVMYFVAMSTFGVREAIPNYNTGAEQNTDEKLVAALQYLPIQLQPQTVFSDELEAIPAPIQEETTSVTDQSQENMTTDDTEYSATTG